jgi:hypothetical protein
VLLSGTRTFSYSVRAIAGLPLVGGGRATVPKGVPEVYAENQAHPIACGKALMVGTSIL